MFIHALRLQERLDRFEAEYEIRTDGQIHLGPINLDAMSRTDLDIAADHSALHEAVRRYAHLKLEAGSLRLAREIRKAESIEAKCNLLYNNQMPTACKWSYK